MPSPPRDASSQDGYGIRTIAALWAIRRPAAIAMEEFWGFLAQISLGGGTLVVDGSDGMATAVGTIEP